MQLTSTVSIRYVEMQTDEEYLAWRNGLTVLLEVLERYQKNQPTENSLPQPAQAG
jgi:hypothetical protein